MSVMDSCKVNAPCKGWKHHVQVAAGDIGPLFACIPWLLCCFGCDKKADSFSLDHAVFSCCRSCCVYRRYGPLQVH
jgi:hypothetical protein